MKQVRMSETAFVAAVDTAARQQPATSHFWDLWFLGAALNRREAMTNVDEASPGNILTGWRWWLACGLVLAASPRGDGAHGGRHRPDLGRAGLSLQPAPLGTVVGAARPGHRSAANVPSCVDPDALLFYWPYGRHGINFHPPLAGQLSLLTHAVFGRWMKDIPVAADGLGASSIALTITIGFGFLARRYGAWVGRGHGGVAPAACRGSTATATSRRPTRPGLLLWAATALAFWKGLYEPERGAGGCWSGSCWGWRSSRRWRRYSCSCRCSSGWSRRGCRSRSPRRRRERLDRRARDDGGDARSRSAWPSRRSFARATVPAAEAHEPVRRSPCERLARCDPGRPARGLDRSAAPRTALPRGARSGAPNGRGWRPGRRSWRSPRSSAGWAIRPGGARLCHGSPTIT